MLKYLYMEKSVLIAKIKKYFAAKKEVAAVYLYGSLARGEAKKNSDIDLAVLFADPSDDQLALRFEYEDDLGRIFGKKVEIQDLNICRIDFAYRVLEEGKLLYSADQQKRLNFEVKTMNDYFDLKPFFDEYYEVLKEQSLRGNFHD